MTVEQIEGGKFGLDTTVMDDGDFVISCGQLWPFCVPN